MKNMVTVLMTTYNEEEGIFKDALNSIINQTLKDIKVLIIIDNSQNKAIIETIKKYAQNDDRIRYVINEENLGLPMALNKGIELVDTKYIARMDSDDIAEFDRLEKQLKFAIKNTNVDLFGTNITYMDYKSNILYKRGKIPTEYCKLKNIMKYVNVLNHPTFFGKTEVFKKVMYRNLKYSQDYDFTCRLLENGYRVENMPDYLLKYRLPCKSSESKIIRQKITQYCIQKNYSKGKLSDTNICEQVEEELANIKKEKYLKAIKLYDEAFERKRQKKYIKAIISLLISFVMSKYMRKQILNSFIFYIKMKKG